MTKSEVKHYLQLGDKITHAHHPEIIGVVGVISRDTENSMEVIVEQWNEETSTIINHGMLMKDARGLDGKTYSGNPKDYEDYFPKDEDGEFLFKLDEHYGDIYTPFGGRATTHSVCITGCDRVRLNFNKKNAGIYQMGMDLNRIKPIDEMDRETTCEETMKEERRAVGAPPVESALSL
ncbi:MAG: hypothetical protein GY804_03950 [Alphaproteobacteria bacterium]|nr:hypothetical protein [Alphaproteobacteria bacterium]